MDRGFQPRFIGVAPGFSLPVVCAALGMAQPRWAGPLFCPIPRVAVKARQPWALGRNRFAVQKLGQTFLEYNFELY